MSTARLDNDLTATVAANVRRLRAAKHMTQTELAEAAGVTPQAVWRIEKGDGLHGSCPSLALAVRLAVALGVSLDKLVGAD